MYLAVALFSSTVFIFYANPIDMRGVAVSLIVRAWGVVRLTWPRVSAWLDTANARVTGLFWVVVGTGMSISSVLASGVVSDGYSAQTNFL
ncbi:hypothetical protein SAMN04488691_104139 [Haloferax larsenii]|uniref:Uncharacterized protein n=1 Tax=Haloferax larsenii TaxID=302484 RepID=A0A1H7PMM6_HALLR|nr:hypothetical protein SAMN04488691_104139 [Haloferax larsenii]